MRYLDPDPGFGLQYDGGCSLLHGSFDFLLVLLLESSTSWRPGPAPSAARPGQACAGAMPADIELRAANQISALTMRIGHPAIP
jgi:hypothetical protein